MSDVFVVEKQGGLRAIQPLSNAAVAANGAAALILFAEDHALDQSTAPAQIEFRNVITKLYGQVAAVQDLSLTVRRGEFLTILGPSGSGRTRVLMLLAGFVAPNRGHILISGDSVAAVRPTAVTRASPSKVMRCFRTSRSGEIWSFRSKCAA
nr:ATP-binding cassette domain-containing protein [Mesorhizobium sp.]